jgi:PAS domain S-box-containing protein
VISGDKFSPSFHKEFSLETESILRKGLSLAKIGVWGIQTDTQVLQLSDEAYKIFGFPSGRSYCYSDILRIAHEDDRNRIDLTWQSASQNDELFDVEFRVACSEATRWIRIQCEFRPDGLHAFGIVQDVTSQKIDQERLESIERELQEIMDALDQSSLVSIADRTGKILKVNKRFCEVAKYKEEELVGKYHNIVNSGYHSTEFWKEFWSTINRGEVWRGEIKNRAKDGTEYWVNTTINPIRNEKGEIVHYLSIRQDITSRKHYEQLLLESNLRLEEAQRMAKLGYWECDVRTYKLWWSDEQYKINGVQKTDAPITQDIFLSLLHPEDRKRIDELWARVISEKGQVAATYRIVRPDGEARVISGYANCVCDPQGNVIKLLGVNQDITEFKMTEKALRESEETLRKAQAVAKVGSWKIDLNTGLLEWSDETYKMFNVPKGTPLSYTDFLSFVHPEDKEFVENAWNAALQGAPYDIVHRIIVDNKVKWVREQAEITFDESNNLVCSFGTVQDITAHKVLQDSNLIFNQSLLLTGLGSWRASLKNKDLFLSDNVYNLHGIKKDDKEVTLYNYMQVIHPADRPRVRAAIKKLFVERGSFETEYRVQICPKQIRWISVKGKMLTDPERKPVEIYGIVRDITTEKHNTEELVKARKEAEEASFIKDEFLSVMSHEIRTPLNSVIGLSNLILKRNPREDQLEIMKVLKGSADNLLHLVNDILDFNKIRAGKLELEFIPFRLTVFLQHLYSSFKLAAHDKNIDFTIHTDARIPEVLIGDVTRLNQIFNNLLGNAIKFTQQGYVKFKVDLKEKLKDDCTLVFHIEDTGVGITSDKLETIFQPFQQSESDISRKYGGTGLGLSIVKSLLEILHGNIKVVSTPRKGSTFSVELKFKIASHTSSEDVLPSSEVSAVKFRKNLRILYVEDVESNRFLIENLLSEHGISTMTVPSGSIALQFTKIERFDLILMDIQMPGMDGYEATRKIRSQRSGKNKQTPVLAFTAEPYSEELKKKVSAHGIQDVITKPFDAHVLLEKIHHCLEPKSNPSDMFSFGFYENAFNFDLAKLREIKSAVEKDVDRFRTRLINYGKRKDWKKISAEVHRIRPIFNNLRCEDLLNTLENYEKHDDNEKAKYIATTLAPQVGDLLKQLFALKY